MGKLSSYLPALKYGHKIYPEDIAGMIGLPYVGNIFYVDPYAGSDTANAGNRQNNALKTVAAAYDKCTSGKHDVVLIVPTGGTGRTAETAAINWNKRFTHLIGSAAPTNSSIRAGMSMNTDSISPSFTISENGCIFKNLTIATFQAANLILCEITGDYNYFSNIHFAGIGHTTAGADASARDVRLNGCSETTFDNCTFGLDTVLRSAANANLEFYNASSKCVFNDCIFNCYTSSTGTYFIIDGTTGGQRYNIFNRPTFVNYISTGYGALMGAAIHSWAGSGRYLYRDPVKFGCTAWVDGSATYTYMIGSSSAATYAEGIGYAVAPV